MKTKNTMNNTLNNTNGAAPFHQFTNKKAIYSYLGIAHNTFDKRLKENKLTCPAYSIPPGTANRIVKVLSGE